MDEAIEIYGGETIFFLLNLEFLFETLNFATVFIRLSHIQTSVLGQVFTEDLSFGSMVEMI